ncbi:MAG: transposase [Saprospirales bacterium]|nr:transposase [Saprospirales bacterium]
MQVDENIDQSQVVQAPAKDLPFGRSKAGVSLIVHILISKYVEHLPLHRLIARFARSGLNIPPATMGHWVKVGAEPLLILYEAYQKSFLTRFTFKWMKPGSKSWKMEKAKRIWASSGPYSIPSAACPSSFTRWGATIKGPKITPTFCRRAAMRRLRRVRNPEQKN